MKQSEAKEFLPLIKAWSEGKTLQIQHLSGEWEDVKGKGNFSFSAPVQHYRIKPEPREFWIVVDFSRNLHWGVCDVKPENIPLGYECVHVREVLND